MPENDYPLTFDLDAPVVDAAGNMRFGDVIFPRHENPDGIAPEIVEEQDGRFVRLRVKTGHFVPEPPPKDDGRYDRCELREGKRLKLGAKVFYGFSLRAARNFPSVPLRCVVAQVKMPFGESKYPSPVFSLRIDDGRYLATVEHYFDRRDAGGDIQITAAAPDGSCAAGFAPATDHHNFDPAKTDLDDQVRIVMATDGGMLQQHLKGPDGFSKCSNGVRLEGAGFLPDCIFGWTDFVVHVAVSGKADNADGVVALYVNGECVASAHGEFGVPDADGNTKQYLKVGPYRNDDGKWDPALAVGIEVRGISRGSRPEDVGLAPDVLVALAALAARTGEA